MIDFFRKSDDSEPAMSDSDSNESVPPTSQEVCSWSVGVTSRNEVALTVNHGGSYNSITLYMRFCTCPYNDSLAGSSTG
jgi:hypothetical protein